MDDSPRYSRSPGRSSSPLVDKRLILSRKEARRRIIENETRLLVEKQFDVSPCYNCSQSPLQQYDILKDKHLTRHFKKPAHKKHLVDMGLLTEKGKPVDPALFNMKVRLTSKQEKEQGEWINGVVKSLVEKERMRKQLLKLKREEKEREQRYKRLGMKSRASAIRSPSPESVFVKRPASAPMRSTSEAPNANFAFSSDEEEEREGQNETYLEQHSEKPANNEPSEPRKAKPEGYGGRRAGKIKRPQEMGRNTPGNGIHCPDHHNSKKTVKTPRKRSEKPDLTGVDNEGKKQLEVLRRDKEVFGEMVRVRNNPNQSKISRSILKNKIQKKFEQVKVSLRYIGNAPNAKIEVLQQPDTGMRGSRVYLGDGVRKGTVFTFASRRSRDDGIYAINIFVNGVSNVQLNSCCEFKYPKGMVKGDFIIADITGAWNCKKCQVRCILKKSALGKRPINGPDDIKSRSSRNALNNELKIEKSKKGKKVKSYPVPPSKRKGGATGKSHPPETDSDDFQSEYLHPMRDDEMREYEDSFSSLSESEHSQSHLSATQNDADNELTADDKAPVNIPFGIPLKSESREFSFISDSSDLSVTPSVSVNEESQMLKASTSQRLSRELVSDILQRAINISSDNQPIGETDQTKVLEQDASTSQLGLNIEMEVNDGIISEENPTNIGNEDLTKKKEVLVEDNTPNVAKVSSPEEPLGKEDQAYVKATENGPKPNGSEPKVDEGQPIAGESEPKADESEPKVDETEANHYQTESSEAGQEGTSKDVVEKSESNVKISSESAIEAKSSPIDGDTSLEKPVQANEELPKQNDTAVNENEGVELKGSNHAAEMEAKPKDKVSTQTLDESTQKLTDSLTSIPKEESVSRKSSNPPDLAESVMSVSSIHRKRLQHQYHVSAPQLQDGSMSVHGSTNSVSSAKGRRLSNFEISTTIVSGDGDISKGAGPSDTSIAKAGGDVNPGNFQEAAQIAEEQAQVNDPSLVEDKDSKEPVCEEPKQDNEPKPIPLIIPLLPEPNSDPSDAEQMGNGSEEDEAVEVVDNAPPHIEDRVGNDTNVLDGNSECEVDDENKSLKRTSSSGSSASSFISEDSSLDRDEYQNEEEPSSDDESSFTKKEINFQSQHLSSKEIERLSSQIAKSNTISIVNFGQCEMGPGGIETICKGLLSNSSVTWLNLNRNYFGADGAEYLAEVLMSPSCCISKLFVRHNQLRDEGCSIICKALQTNTSVNILDMGDNFIGKVGILEAGELLFKNNCLEELGLSGNEVESDQDWLPLFQSLKDNKCLKKLFLAYNSVGDVGLSELANQVSSSVLQFIDLEGNRVTDGGAKELIQAIQMDNQPLREVLMEDNDIDEAILQKVSRALQANKGV
eukprot:Nk52_evm85s207 gene=Nk52_evmTU85s207